MDDLKFQVLFPKSSRQTNHDKRFVISTPAPYLFSTALNMTERNSPRSVELMSLSRCVASVSAQMGHDSILTIKSTGEHPIFIVNMSGHLEILSEVAVPSYGKQILFITSVDSHDDKVKTFKLTFDCPDGNEFVVTLE